MTEKKDQKKQSPEGVIHEISLAHDRYIAQSNNREKKVSDCLKKNSIASQDILTFLYRLNSEESVIGLASFFERASKYKGREICVSELPVRRKGRGHTFYTYLTSSGEPSFWLYSQSAHLGGDSTHRIGFNDEGVGEYDKGGETLYLSEYVGRSRRKINAFKRGVLRNLEEIAKKPLSHEVINAAILERLGLSSLPYV
jgi:hypothetical protein